MSSFFLGVFLLHFFDHGIPILQTLLVLHNGLVSLLQLIFFLLQLFFLLDPAVQLLVVLLLD